MKLHPLALRRPRWSWRLAGASAGARPDSHRRLPRTVFPFATAVAEHFGQAGKFKAPVIESTGTGGGFKLFCAGVGGDDTPDIANASRKIKASESRDLRQERRDATSSRSRSATTASSSPTPRTAPPSA